MLKTEFLADSSEVSQNDKTQQNSFKVTIFFIRLIETLLNHRIHPESFCLNAKIEIVSVLLCKDKRYEV